MILVPDLSLLQVRINQSPIRSNFNTFLDNNDYINSLLLLELERKLLKLLRENQIFNSLLNTGIGLFLNYASNALSKNGTPSTMIVN